MGLKQFFLAGEGSEKATEVDISTTNDIEALKLLIAGQFHVVNPSGIAFQSSGAQINDLNEITAATSPIGITIDGHEVREPDGPKGLPYVGNYFEIFPDHIGNHERLFSQYGPIFHTTTLGKTVYQINDPEMALIAFTEGEFFTKATSNPNHPLYPLADDNAGVFLSDTSSESFSIVRKFMPPALGPKAVRHYAPIMNESINGAEKVFDELERRGEAWNVYQYMVKLASEAVAKVVLGMEFHHFTEVDAPLHPMVIGIADALSLNKKIASKGELYAKLPFGDPKKLHDLMEWQYEQIEKAIHNHSSSGDDDLELQDAALDAANMIDYFCRAKDVHGEKLPKQYLKHAVITATGAGFSTTATLLSWLIYGLVTYPGMQARLLQELIDHGYSDDQDVTPELIEKLSFQENYVKEMQRLHNPSYQPGRVAKTDLILPGGYKLKEGDVVIVAIHHVHNNPEHWDSPKKFDPDRWDTEKVKNRHKAAYCPFAVGGRSCLGFNFALQEVKVFLPKLVYRYHWSKEGESAVQYDPFFQLVRPINLYVRTEKRTVWPSPSDLNTW